LLYELLYDRLFDCRLFDDRDDWLFDDRYDRLCDCRYDWL
jgi:hypothetical protein